VNAAYPLLDIVLLVSVLVIVASNEWALGARWGLLLLGFACFVGADAVYLYQTAAGTYVNGTVLDAVWTLGLAAPALASAAPAGRLPSAAAMNRLNLWVPVAGFAVAVVVLAVEALELGRSSVVAVAILCATVGVARHARAYGGALAEKAAQQAARTDVLTGLLNRRGHEEALAHLAGTGDRFSLLLVDLDGFKAVNDTHGHHVGDDALRTVADRLRALGDRYDAVARLGGDEFALLVSGDATAGARLAQDVHRSLGGGWHVGGHDVALSASVGVATYPDDADDPARLGRRADRAMYAAKHRRLGWVHHADRLRADRPATVPSPRVAEPRTVSSADV
jgi:diguanylate cyclase (GGDEF)-like protein